MQVVAQVGESAASGISPCIEVECSATGSYASILVAHRHRLLTTHPAVVEFLQDVQKVMALAHYVNESGVPTEVDMAYSVLTGQDHSVPEADLLRESL